LGGLGLIETKEATAALIALAGGENADAALNAALTLNRRLPDPEFDGQIQGRGPFRFDQMAIRRRLAASSWDPRFAKDVRVLAVKYLAGKETRPVGTGAFMMEAVGTTEDAPTVKAAIERFLSEPRNNRDEPSADILNDPEPLPELLRAMQMLHRRGYELGPGLSGNGEILLYFAWLADKPGPRPNDWFQTFDAFRTAGPFVVREAALRSIPQPVPENCVPAVLAGIADPDYGVERAACEVAGKSGNPQFVKPLLEVVATAHHEWLLRDASNAAHMLGARYELYQAWVPRLVEDKMLNLALGGLQGILSQSTGSGGRIDLPRGERFAMQKAWQEFLAKHEKELRSGKTFKLGGPELTPAMYGRARQFQLPDGKSWPPSPSPDR
jgi:hypothetical protein